MKVHFPRVVRFGLAALLVCAGAGAAAVYFPRWAFPYTVECEGLELRSDLPFAAGDGQRVLMLAAAKLRDSAFASDNDRHYACLCNTAWRRRLFFGLRAAGGLHYYGSRAVFLSGGVVAENRLVNLAGQKVTDERTLDYFIVHEVTHALAEKAVGVWRYHRLADWVKEGYADYVGRGSALRDPANPERFLKNSPEMSSPSAAPYLRYNFLVAYHLEQLGWDPARLHREPVSRAEAEAAVHRSFSE